MIGWLALAVLVLAARVVTLSWGGALVLTAVVLFGLWCIEPFGNRKEWRLALAAWRDRIGGK